MAVEATTGVNASAQAAGAPPQATATDLVAQFRGNGALDTQGLAAEVRSRTQGDPPARSALSAELETQMTPVERGQFAAAVDAANDNEVYSRAVAGETFEVGHPNAPAVGTWGSQPAGSGYREAWDRTAVALGTSDPAAITAEIERQLYAPASGTIELDPITVTADRPSQESVGAFFEGAILGDFGDNRSWSATAGQVVMGFVPIAGQIADARDTAAAFGQVLNGEEGGWLNLGASVVGWVPGIGDGLKAAIRGGERALDAGTEVAQQAVRQSDTVTRQADEVVGAAVTVRRFDNADDFNRAANNAQPNTRYEFGRYSYTTDARGRVTTAEGRVQIDPVGRNDPDLQRQIGHEGRPTDVGFHVIADMFGGQTNRLNVVPGNGRPIGDNLPNLNQGQYGQFERTVRGIVEENPGRNVEVRVDMRYADGNTTSRPDEFVAMYRVDGGRWREQTMVNK